MDFVIVFAIGIALGFFAAWMLMRTTSRPNREISEQYGVLNEQLRSLTDTTSQLQRVLSDRTKRGKWGERRALQVLELAGFEKDKHFRYQSASPNDEGKRFIPDFTFEFPNNIRLYMDSKFPLDHYEAYTTANNDDLREQELKEFFGNVHSHVNKLNKYVSPGQNSVPFVILFIPFESLFRFIHEQDAEIIDYALERQVIMCSPLTLYVLLRIIRQSLDAFAYTQAAEEIRQSIEQMRREWDKYGETFKQVGDQLEKAQVAYTEATKTREMKLHRTFNKVLQVIDDHRSLPKETDV